MSCPKCHSWRCKCRVDRKQVVIGLTHYKDQVNQLREFLKDYLDECNRGTSGILAIRAERLLIETEQKSI